MPNINKELIKKIKEKYFDENFMNLPLDRIFYNFTEKYVGTKAEYVNFEDMNVLADYFALIIRMKGDSKNGLFYFQSLAYSNYGMYQVNALADNIDNLDNIELIDEEGNVTQTKKIDDTSLKESEIDKSEEIDDLNQTAIESAKLMHNLKLKATKDSLSDNEFLDPQHNIMFSKIFLSDIAQGNRVERSNDQSKPLYRKAQERVDNQNKKLDENTIPNQQNIIANKLHSYFLIKEQNDKRTISDIFKHPWNSFMEWITLNKIKKDLKQNHDLDENMLTTLKDVCYDNKDALQDIEVIDNKGTKYNKNYSEKEYQESYNQLNKAKAKDNIKSLDKVTNMNPQKDSLSETYNLNNSIDLNKSDISIND